MAQCSGTTRLILVTISSLIIITILCLAISSTNDAKSEPMNSSELNNKEKLSTKREAPALQPPQGPNKPDGDAPLMAHRRHQLRFNTSGLGASSNRNRRIVAQQKPLEVNPKTLELIRQAEKVSGQPPSPECLEDLEQFISIPDRDVPGWGDERDFESPTIGQCAKSAYEASIMFAVWGDGRCFFKKVVRPSLVRLMTADGLDLGNYDIPGWDQDSPVEFSGAMRWLDAETKGCDLVAKDGHQQFWCKQFAHSPGKVLLFRQAEADEVADLVETIDDTSGFLEKFWPISDRNWPGNDRNHFPSPDVRSCAKSAWQDGERLAVWSAGTCFYKHTQEGAELFNRHGQHVGNYDLWFSDVEKETTNEETKNGWIRDGKCDMVARTEKRPGNVEFWCKGYVKTEYCIMLFRRN